MTIYERLYTADDLWEISHRNTNSRYELYEGILIEMTPTGDAHGLVGMEFGRLMANFVRERNLGKVVAAETGFILSKDPYTVIGADIAFISKARLTPVTGKYYPIAPDLAVEIVSPNDRAAEINH